MAEKLFTVYKSSAGSGKTYTLTRSYLYLALQYPEKFKRILAVTFTNKATQEMKDRIIERLAAFSEDNHSGMGEELLNMLSIKPAELTKRSSELLAHILHNYSRFSIQTIDTFFQTVMRSFARELGLNGDGELLLDTSEPRERVVDLLLEDLTENQHLRNWLLEFSSDKLEASKSWDVRKDILEFSNQLFREEFLQIEKSLVEGIKDSENIVSYKAKLTNIIKIFEEEMNALAVKGIALMSQHGLAVEDFSYGKSGAANYFNNIRQGKYVPGLRVFTALETGGESLASKKSKKKEEIANIATGGLLNVFEELIACYNRSFKKYSSAKAIASNIYNLGILWLYQKKLIEYKQEEGISFINDATVFLNQIIAEEETPFIYEKMGAFYDHFLIDEFQDTSVFQWNNFKPLINNSLDHGKSSLVVGDVKQSIYRWRGGDWRLLLGGIKKDVRSHAYAEDQLNRNYRSKPLIIDFNNSVFKDLPLLLQQNILQEIDGTLEDELQEMVGSFANAYKEVAQEKKEAYDYDGYINLQFFEKEDEAGIGWKEKALEKLVEDLKQLQDAGLKLSDMAILVRKASHGKEINDFLLNYQAQEKTDYKFDVISNESLYLSASLLVSFMLNCMRFLYSPNNRVALAQMALYYQQFILKSTADTHEILSACNENTEIDHALRLLPVLFVAERSELLNMSLLDLSERLIQYFSLNQQLDEIPYLQAFQDVLLDYGSQGDIQDFLDWWELNQYKYAVKIPESAEAIRLMTVHKSKGLQFKVVLIPFLDWPLNHGTRGPMLWLNAAIEDLPKDVPYMPIKHSGGALKESYFANEFWQEEIKSYLDNLNLLYVAFTRAEDILIAYGQQGAGKNQIAEAVQSVLQGRSDWNEEEFSLQIGNLKADFNHDDRRDRSSVIVSLKEYPSTNWHNRLEVKKGKALKLSKEKQYLKRKINTGLMVHDVFSKMKKLSDKEAVLQALWADNALSSEELESVNKLVFNRLNNSEELKNWFVTDWEVRTEVPIVDPSGKDVRIDRVHLKGDKAKIIDFKTGMKKAADLEQIRAYQSVLKRMGYREVEGYLAYLEPFELVKVL